MITSLTRRSFLKGACASVSVAATYRMWTPGAAFADDSEHTLVVVFLRGALDGLSMVVPAGDNDYYRARPTLAIPANRVLDIDGTFGLHPAMASIHPLFADKRLAAVHAAGNLDDSRSHFEAQANMERGTEGANVSTGWLARHVFASNATAVPLHAIAWGSALPASLQGDSAALSLQALDSFGLAGRAALRDPTRDALASLYEGSTFETPAGAVLEALDLVENVAEHGPQPHADASYPDTHVGNALREIARTIKADVGLSTATVDVGGWDLHAGAGNTDTGAQRTLLADLADSMAAFATDLADRPGSYTLITMSEFGRRTEENGSNGTDHGWGNVMLAMGDNLSGTVVGDWRGLGGDALYRGDVPVTTDYRNVVGELLLGRVGAADLSPIFPGLTHEPVGVTT
ncbi:MAG: DUF1501 domain-containing protein [Nitriliruptorales bacterium]|nr:DUF1501 domain-containing protein [Nitriliruptorales bacterium]